MVARCLVSVLLLAACQGVLPVDTGGEDPATVPVEAETAEPGAGETGGEDGGDGDSGGGDSGGGDSGGGEPVVPRLVDGRWVFAWGSTTLELDPALGARVTRLAVGDVDVLTDATTHATNWGATFWTSPQSDWGWPPVAALDTGAYAATLDGGTLVLTSGAATVGGGTIDVEKRVSVDTTGITFDYRIRNLGAEGVSLAGWEVARVPVGGLTFFRAGDSLSSSVGTFPAVEQDGVVWYDGTPPAEAAKLVADGTGGWLAHVVDGVFLLKSFADVPSADQAPGEGEIEVYAAGGYTEVENQGAFGPIGPGESATYTVRWTVSVVPEDVWVGVGSEGLVGLAGR
ncbi:MAG: hypothetical protein Q8P41_29435 [Pseudomonadota bacterium]|nr:hypothetical protein [Pseudomonadota bacterium]